MLLLGLADTIWASEIDTLDTTYVYHNEETSYYIYLDDWADLLTDDDEDTLLEKINKIAGYISTEFRGFAAEIKNL